MKTSEKKFWAILVVSIIVILFFLFLIGCDDLTGPEGRITTEIRVFSVKDQKCDKVDLDEEGRVGRAEGYMVARYYIGDEPLAVGGLKARVVTPVRTQVYYLLNGGGGGYWCDIPGDRSGVKSTLTTNNAGFVHFTAWCERWGDLNLRTSMWIKAKYTLQVGVMAGFVNWRDYRTNFTKPVPWYEHYWDVDLQRWFVGGYYFSGTSPPLSIPAEQVNAKVSVAANNTFSQGDMDFLESACQQPQTGFTIQGTEWCMQTTDGVKPIGNFVILDNCDPNTIKYYATPYFVSVYLSLAGQIDQSCIGVSIPATIRFGSREPVAISVSIAAISEDGLRAVAHTDYFVPVDSSEYNLESPKQRIYDRWSNITDPNAPEIDIYAPMFLPVSDPNFPPIIDPNDIDSGVVLPRLNPDRFKTVYVLPAGDRETMRVHFENDVIAALPLVQYWLSGNKAADVNNDGIVNLSDLPN